MDKRKSFILHFDSLDILEELSKEQIADLFIAIRDYNLGKEVELSGLMKAVFIPFKNQFDRDLEKYKNKCTINAKNGKKGGRPKETQDNPENPVGYFETQDNPEKPYNDNDNDNKSDNDNKKDKDKINLEKLLNYWNSKYQLKNRYTDRLLVIYNKIKNKYTTEDIEYSIGKYNEYLEKNKWYTNRFSLYDYLKQSNGLEKFYNS